MLGQSLKLRVTQTLRTFMRVVVGETVGDIPMYSLHRIKHRLRSDPLNVSTEVRMLLIRALIAANQQYKQDSGKDWNCITSNGLTRAIDAVDSTTQELTISASTSPASIPGLAELLTEAQRSTMEMIRCWFVLHSEDILYNTNGQIPWPVVRRLRANLAVWAAGLVNPFNQDVSEAVLEVAQAEGISTSDAEDAWEAMGGRLFTTEEE